MDEIGIGSTVWARSQYRNSGPQECNICGETKVSWLVRLSTWADPVKFPKKSNTDGERWSAMQSRGRRYQLFLTHEEFEEYKRRRQACIDTGIWLNEHRYKIVSAVGRCADIATLRKVATLVGYTTEEEK